MSGAQVSGFADPNILYKSLSGLGTAEVQSRQNELLQQQQTLGAGDTEMAARIASTLQSLPTPEARASAYPTMLAQARANGYRLPHAPETYPGDDAIAATARMGTPSQTQQEWGFNLAANKAYTAATTPPATTSTSGGVVSTAPATSGTIEPDALTRAQAVRDGLIKRGLDVDTATGLAANALHESGANPNVGPGDRGASHGAFQWTGPRYDRYIAINGHPPDNAPLDEQLDFVVHEFNTTEGAARDRIAAAQGPAAKAAAISQYYLRPKDVQPEMDRRSATATQLATRWGGAGTSTAAPVIAGDSLASQGGLGGSGVVGASPKAVLAGVQADSRAGKYDGKPVVLSTGASNDPTDIASVEQQIREAQGGNAGKITVLGVGPAIEAKAPGTNAKLQALSKAYGADFVPLPADQMSPDGVHPTAQGYATLKAAIAPAQGGPGGGGQPGRYQVASNAPVGPPASGAPTSGQPQAQIPQPPANRAMPGAPDGPAAATPPPVASAPAGGPQPPQLAPLNAAGLTPIQQRQIDAYAADPRVPLEKRMAAQQAFANQNIQLAQKAFSDYVQLQQLQVSQGQLTNAQAETNLKYWQANHPELAPNAREATIAYRTLQELAPAMRAPNPPQDVVDRYNNAAIAYQDFKTITDPISKATVQVPSRPLPAGFPPPSSARGGEGGVQTLIPGMSPAQQEVEKKLGENFADQDTKAYAGANNSLYALGQMNNASEILDKQGGSAWTATGPAANLRIATAQGVNTLGSLFGVAPTFDPAAIGSWEALNKQTKLMGFKIINAAFGASREAASVINNATSAVPSAENTYLGFRLVSSGIEQELQRERELYEFKADRVRGGQPLATAEADFNKTHPIDVYTSRAIANAVPDDIAGYLVAHPDTVKAFDGHFGPGTGEFILKGGRTGLGQAARGR